MILDFYKSIFPPLGLRALAVFKNGLKAAPTHSFYDNNDDLIEAADTYNNLGKNVYHGCAVYQTSDNRKGENVLAAKSLWLDLDVGPSKPYATQREAAAHYEEFRKALGLPLSHVVSSGNGVHEYQPFTVAISPDKWDRLAALYAQCLDHYGVKHDTSRTQDKASILRIPGTSNFKATTKEVKLKRLGVEASAQEIWRVLKAYADTNNLIVGAVRTKGKPLLTNDLIGTQDFPPSEGGIIAQHCPIINEIESSGGDVGYEVWWRAMGVAKHTTDPDAVAASWTRNRESTGHEKSDHSAVRAAWATGPTTCADFSKHSHHCSTCKFNGKVKSPIQLGVPAQPPITPPVLLLQPAPKPVVNPADWEFGAPALVKAMCTATRTGTTADGKMTRSVLGDDGNYKQTPFCDRYWQVMKRIRGTDNVWKLEIGYQEYAGRPYKTFLIESATVASAELLKKEFAARELHIYGGKGSMEKTQELIRWQQATQYDLEVEVKTYASLGWETADPALRGDVTGDFVMGNEVFRAKQKPQPVLLGDKVEDSVRRAFKAKGTTAEWVSIIDQIYNRKGAEAYQFLIASSFASPLVCLVPGGGEWHGIPIVVTGDSGAAKSTSCLVAMSVYGFGQSLKFNASAGQGDTINATTLKLGTLRNLPCILDEMSGLEPTQLQAVLSIIANGKGRDRMGPDGRMIHNPHFWDALPLINTNDKIHEVLEGLRSQHSTQAMQLRTFEVDLYSRDLSTVFKGVNKTLIEDDLLDGNYGMVGREWIQFVVNNHKTISSMLGVERAAYMINPDDTSAIRFYKDLIITVKVAARLAKQKGFIGWDVGAMIRWAEKKLNALVGGVSVTDWDAAISDFVASFHGRTIVTKHIKMGPGRRAANPEIPQENLTTNAAPVARKAVDDKRFIFTANFVKEWSQKNRVLPTTLIAEMNARGYLKGTPGEVIKPVMLNIGSGTTVTRSQAPCYEFNYDKISYHDSEDGADMSNVVPIQSVTQVVTVGQKAEGAALATP